MRIPLLAIFYFLATCFAQTTDKSHHGLDEAETFQFGYNSRTHDLVVQVRLRDTVKCFIAQVKNDEKQLVHSDSGLRTVELRVLGQLSTAIQIDSSRVNEDNMKYCGHHLDNGTVSYYVIL